ncbi:MAG TPA: AMP-binding protein [Gammaproteobacteria bacterium]|nr:AMP-binding protein [Gammaproteobacteria bacterium]
MSSITPKQLLPFYPVEKTEKLAYDINHILLTCSPDKAWNTLSKEILSRDIAFECHLLLFSICYPNWRDLPDTAPAWLPDADTLSSSNLALCLQETRHPSIKAFHEWSTKHPGDFWQYMIARLDVLFYTKPSVIYDATSGAENPVWLSGATFNIADSCLTADPEKIAIIQQKKSGPLEYYRYDDLNKLSNRIANSLVKCGFSQGDALAILMPMNFYAVAIYLGILKMGGVVVSIADSFSPDEIELRLKIASAKGIFTQDFISREDKIISLYEKVIKTSVPMAIVLSLNETPNDTLRKNDISWENFLIGDDHFNACACEANTFCNILFSSGTTGNPKAIPWTHLTAIKAASDAHLHQDIHENDILAWPTSLGWMMGPWLIFAGLMNHATLALYEDSPRDRFFGEFVQDAKVTLLGVVPTLVATWRQSASMQGLDWHHIRRFSSTGECSNAEDMLYLMMLADYKPVIEYCGGTEIGGAYVSGTLLENNYPSLFTTPAFGIDFVLLDEKGSLTDHGEVALIPPSIGLSQTLLNADHHKTYYAGMPTLPDGRITRRHGDQLQRLPSGYYRVTGRTDDTMNLSGIKTSSQEIERVLAGMENITEIAAIAITPLARGPGRLVIIAATDKNVDRELIKKNMQKRLNEHLNPLFKIHEVILVRELPKTASNKMMRRLLREQYQST